MDEHHIVEACVAEEGVALNQMLYGSQKRQSKCHDFVPVLYANGLLHPVKLQYLTSHK